MEDMERTNAMQYMLLVYLGANRRVANRRTKTPEGIRTGKHNPKRQPYLRLGSEWRPALAQLTFASLEHP
jgi:hypothetical protein